MANGIPKCPPKWCLKKINRNFEINAKTGLITWSRDYRQMKKGAIVGSPNNKGYIRVRLYSSEHGTKYLLGHHVAWYMYYGEWPSFILDHKNGKEGDNRKKNIRKATRQQNRRNSKISKNNECGHRGIRTHKHICKNGNVLIYYMPRIYVNNKRISLGCFKKLEDAIEAREAGEKKYFKEFAYANR